MRASSRPRSTKDSSGCLPALPGLNEGMMNNFANPNAYAVDGRGVAYSMAFFSAKHLGAGQYYLMTIRDKDRKPLDGNGTYRLNVPANAPVKLYWSVTVYDRDTHALIRDQAVVEPLLQHAETAEERRRFGRCLFRPESACMERNRTGCRPMRTAALKSCSAFMARRSRSSTNSGCCRISKELKYERLWREHNEHLRRPDGQTYSVDRFSWSHGALHLSQQTSPLARRCRTPRSRARPPGDRS